MSIDYQPMRSGTTEGVAHHIQFVGGTAAVTKVHGKGVATTYVSTGIVDFVWSDNPGTFVGAQFGFQATTASAVKGYTCVPGVFNATTFTLRINITGASEALVDLAALQWLNATVNFKMAGTGV